MTKGYHHKMPTALEGARKNTPPAELVPTHNSEALLAHITAWLDDAKAEKVVAIDIRGKSSIGDYMVIASGRSDRHVGAIADQLQRKLKKPGTAAFTSKASRSATGC